MRWLKPRQPKPSMTQLPTQQPICVIDGLLCPLTAILNGHSEPGQPCNRSCALTIRDMP